MDTWQFWVGIAYFGLAAVTVILWVNYSRVSKDQARTVEVVAARHADVVANATAQYTQCIKGIPYTIRINRFLNGVEAVHAVLLQNALASHALQPKNTALYRTQQKNIARLRSAFLSVKGLHFPVNSAKKCRALRKQLQAKE